MMYRPSRNRSRTVSNLMIGLLGSVSLMALLASPARATPANGVFVAGGAGGSIVPSGGDVTVNTGTDPRTVITWDSFNIDNGDTVLFNQLNNQSIALNKVTGPVAQSTIDGILQSNGHVWILNPAGVAFGANANVDVGALLATTADIDTATFMATDPTTGTFTFTDTGGTGAIMVANGADLDTTGLLALVAPMVSNAGDLTSSHGDVLLGGAEAFRIKFASTSRDAGAFNELLVTDFIIDGGSTTAAAGGDVVHQTSTGRAVGGRIIADASRVGGGAFLNMEGLVEAQNVGTLSGDVMLLGGSDITAGVVGATATDAVKTDNMTIVAPGTATVQGTAVTIGNGAGPLSTGGSMLSTPGTVAITGTTGDVTLVADIRATTGSLTVSAANGNVDAAELTSSGDLSVTARDIDLANGNTTGATTVVRSTAGSVSLTATAGDMSKVGGIVDIDAGTNVVLSGPVTGAPSAWVIDFVPGTVTTDDVNVQFFRIGSTGNIATGDITASQSAEAVSAAGTVSVGNVSSNNNITLSGTDIDLTGAGGSLQSTGGVVSVTATGGAGNNISAAGGIDIDADSVVLSGATTGTAIDIDADNGTVTANGVTATGTSVSIDATGNIDVDDVTATATGIARVVSSAGEVDVGDVTGNLGVTISGTDVDLTGPNGRVIAGGGVTAITATGGGANNISSAGAIDIDGAVVTLSGATSAVGNLDITSAAGTTASDISGGGVVVVRSIAGPVDVDNVTGTGTVQVIANANAVDVGNVTGPGGITLSGTDVDLTGAGGLLQSTNGLVSVTASGGGANNISSAGGIDIDGDSVSLTGAMIGTSVDIDADNGTVIANSVTASAGVASIDATGNIDVDDVSGATTARVVSGTGEVDLGDISGTTGVTVSGTDVDLTGTNGSVQSSDGAVSLTASGAGVADNISAGGAMDVDGNSVVISGAVNATSVDIDADTTTVTANNVTATTGTVSIDAVGDIDVDDVSAVLTARVVSGIGAVDVGDISGGTGVTVAGTDVDLTGTNGSLQSLAGAVSVTASGGGANNISSAGAIDIDGDSVSLTGTTTGTTVDIDADNGTVTTNNVTATTGAASIDATGNIDVDDVSAATTARVVSSAGAVDVAGVSGGTGVTVGGTDIDMTGSINAGTGTASLAASAGDISTPGLFDVDGGAIVLTGPVNAGTGLDLDATAGGITATGGDMISVAGNADLMATGAASVEGIKVPGDISIKAAAINYSGTLMSQGNVLLNAMSGGLFGSPTSAVMAPAGGLSATALGGPLTLNNVSIQNNLSAIGGSVTMTGTSPIGGTATLQALTGNVHVVGNVNAAGGIVLIEAPAGTAIINEIASSGSITLTVLDLDLTGTISAGDQFNLSPSGTGNTIILGGSGGTDGVTLRRPQGFTLDASELTRIVASRLQFDAGNNDLALLDATFDPTSLQSLVLGADANARIIAAGNIRGLPNLQLGFVDGSTQARPELVLVSGSLGGAGLGQRLKSLRIESADNIVIGTQKFLEAFEAAPGGLDLATLGEPDLARFGGTQDHVFIAVDQLRLFAPGEIAQLNTGTGSKGAGIVFGEAPIGKGTIEKAATGPERVNLFGVVINAADERVTGFEAGLEPNILGPGLTQHGELRLNLCVIGDSSSCSIAILREAQESARSRNSALSSLTNTVFFSFEDDSDNDDDEDDDLGGVAGAGNEGLWGIGQ